MRFNNSLTESSDIKSNPKSYNFKLMELNLFDIKIKTVIQAEKICYRI